MQQFVSHGGRNEHSIKQPRQDVGTVNQDEIVQRTGIRDGGTGHLFCEVSERGKVLREFGRLPRAKCLGVGQKCVGLPPVEGEHLGNLGVTYLSRAIGLNDERLDRLAWKLGTVGSEGVYQCIRE